MQDWLNFLNNELPENDRKNILPVARSRNLDFKWIPESQEEFTSTINKAPIEILEGLGFIRYSSLPEEPYRHCKEKMEILIGRDHELFLFPAEWYPIIPKGFPVINIFAEVSTFEPGQTDSIVRLGCLGYGISVFAGV